MISKRKHSRGGIWQRGRRQARGYYVRVRMSGPRRFRLKELRGEELKHDFDSPQAARRLGWHLIKRGR